MDEPQLEGLVDWKLLMQILLLMRDSLKWLDLSWNDLRLSESNETPTEGSSS